MADIGYEGGVDINIVSGDDTGNKALIDGDGNLNVANQAAVIPSTATARFDIAQDVVSGTDDQFFVIPTSEVLTIVLFKAGCETSTSGSKVEIFDAPNGNTTGIVLIEALYVNGQSEQSVLKFISDTGDGTKAILLRRLRFSGAGREIFGKWEGYSE